MSTQNPPPLLSQLRSATAAAHATLDSSTNLAAITASPEACADYIGKFAAATREVFSEVDWDLAEALNLPDALARLDRYQQLPGFSLNPSQSSPPKFIGILYVLEGSVHGGASILQTLRNDFPEATFPGIDFLKGFGQENVVLWKRFIAWLQSVELTQQQADAACVAACEAFVCFQKHLIPEQRDQ